MLDDVQIQEFANNGFLHIPALLSQETVANLRAEIAQLSSNPPRGLLLSYEADKELGTPQARSPRKIRNIAQFSQLIHSFCVSALMASVVKDILGSSIGFYGDQVLFKQAYRGTAKPLHQDWAYFRIEPPDSVITCWCALDPADETNGCMHYVPGSHKNGVVAHTPRPNTPHLVVEGNPCRLIPVTVTPGDCIVHHSLTLHMTPANISEQDRWALILHYVRLNAHFPPRSSHASPMTPID